MIGFSGCKDDNPEPPSLATLTVFQNATEEVADGGRLTVPLGGATLNLAVKSNRDWAITPTTSDWLTISPTSGSKDATTPVAVVVSANEGAERSVTFTAKTSDNQATRTFVVYQPGSDSPGAGAIYFEDFGDFKDGAAIRAASGITSGWPTIEQFGSVTDSWRRGGSVDQSGVAYTGTAQVRNSGELYDPVAGSAISTAPYVSMGSAFNFTAGNISTGGKDNFTFKFALQNTVSTAPTSPFAPTFGDVTPTTVKVQAGFDGIDWADLTYTVAEEDGNGWYWATSEFKIPASTAKLYIKFSGFTGGTTLRIEDLTLEEGGNGSLITPEAPPAEFGVSSEAVAVPSAGGDATVDVTGNVDWTVTVKDGGDNLVSAPAATGSKAGTITLNFKENTDTENEKVVTITVATTAEVATKSFDVVFTQYKATAPGADTYSRITATSGIASGMYLFVGHDTSEHKADDVTFYTMGTLSTNYVIADNISSYYQSSTGIFSDVDNYLGSRQVTLTAVGNNFTIQVGAKYLYSSSTTSNNLGNRDANSDANSEWLITIDATSGLASVVSQGSNTRNDMRFNMNYQSSGGVWTPTTPRFASYNGATTNVPQFYIYKKN